MNLITLSDTHALGRVPLDEGSVHRRDLYLTTHIHTPGGIRNRNSRKRAAADLRLRPHGHCDRLSGAFWMINWERILKQAVVE